MGHQAWFLNMPLAFAYKEEFGEAGLTQNLWKAELGELDTYRRLYEMKLISCIMLILTLSFSYLKYLRRLVIVKLRSFL